MRHSNQMPAAPQLTPFMMEEQRLDLELPPDVCAPHSVSKAEPGHFPKEAYFSHL